ncbi:hypothetical protein TW95_gp0349 [Pandoravirus inopinatum]|uniref:F-box domain protein n=1 Tax=Pandoravirus inopinatum TaxID=1605721 RepID=A0A0B5IWK6_9VIRU|nr:hypothetical protein TW95_gp0349 [Pandoravirus inopinatum]AJF97083.1 hypothetical protein [Pandoravirus inopinatum]
MNIEQLPLELLCMILNGAAPRAGGSGAQLWRARPRRPRPFLDPRWRFAARGVCRLWREVIEHPSPAQATAMGTYLRSDLDAPNIGDGRRVDCPKWPTGRVVCASAVAEWIAQRPDTWSRSRLDNVYTWCRDNAGATRHQVIVALVASDTPEAVAYALDVEWSRLPFCATTKDDVASKSCSHADNPYWCQGRCSAECGLAQHVARAVLACGSVATVNVILSCNLHGWPGHLVRLIGPYGRTDVARHLKTDAPQRNDWIAAARVKEPNYFAYLIDTLAKSTAEHRALYAPPMPYCPFTWTTGYAGGCVEGAAAAHGRWRFFALCDARGIKFDACAAFGVAARRGRARLMDWLWRRDASGPRLLPLVLHDAALLAVRDDGPYPKNRCNRAADAIRWLCEVADYRPGDRRQLAALFIGSDDRQGRTVPALLYLVERWPRTAMELDAALLRRLFCQCAVAGGVAMSRFMRIVGLYCPRVDKPGVDGWQQVDPASFDLWGALTRMCTQHVSWSEALIRAKAMLRMMRVCRAVALGRPPHAVDVHGLQRPCACIVQPGWSHTLCALRHHTDAARLCADDNTPETDPAVRAGLTPLAHWCMPRPVCAADLFDSIYGHNGDWLRASPNTFAGRLAGVFQCILAWLASEGLLIDH